MIESSFQDGNTAPGGAGRQASCEHPSLLGTRSCGTVARAFLKGWTDSISGGAESSPGRVRAGSSAGAGRPRTGHGKGGSAGCRSHSLDIGTA